MVADTIKQLRQNANMTQTEFAKKLGITRSSINAWEMGISVPSTQYVVELSNLFKVTTDYILGIDKTNTINIDDLSEEQTKIIYSLIQYFQKDNIE